MKSISYKLAKELKIYSTEGSIAWIVANDCIRLIEENEDLQRRLKAYKQSCKVADTQIEALKNEIVDLKDDFKFAMDLT